MDPTKPSAVFMASDAKEFDYQQLCIIYRSLGHPRRQILESMLKEAKYDTKDLHMFLNKLYENCVTCLKFKRSSVTPKVSPPMARDFNQTVALDLKVWPKFNVIILYIVDCYTRYTQAHIINDKKPESVIEKIS